MDVGSFDTYGINDHKVSVSDEDIERFIDDAKQDTDHGRYVAFILGGICMTSVADHLREAQADFVALKEFWPSQTEKIDVAVKAIADLRYSLLDVMRAPYEATGQDFDAALTRTRKRLDQ